MKKQYKCGYCGIIKRSRISLDKHQRDDCEQIKIRQTKTSQIDGEKLRIRNRIEQLASQYEWIRIAKDGVLELFADHYMLSSLRTCEAKFEEEIIKNVVTRKRQWSLSFGTAFHKWMEWFDYAEDRNFKGEWPVESIKNGDSVKELPTEISVANLIKRAQIYWNTFNLDQFYAEPGFEDLQGWNGAATLLLDYWNQYGNGKERLRTVGTEIGFGKDKEVPILTDPTKLPWAPFRAYLTGRIDRAVDNGKFVGPMDRKTHRFFKGNEASKYKPHDGMLGYSYTINRILGDRFKEQNRNCNGIFIDMIALKMPGAKSKIKERFIRKIHDFTQSQMDEFIQRQISSFAMIYEIMVLGRIPQWNTYACHNIFYRDCPYKQLHEVDALIRPQIFNTFYQYREQPWSPYRIPQEKEDVITPSS